jgi:hypothetical protein
VVALGSHEEWVNNAGSKWKPSTTYKHDRQNYKILEAGVIVS